MGFYLSEVLYRVLPVFFEVFEDALGEHYGALALPDVTVCEYLTFMEVMAAADVQLYP